MASGAQQIHWNCQQCGCSSACGRQKDLLESKLNELTRTTTYTAKTKISWVLSETVKVIQNFPCDSPLKADVLVTWVSRIRNIWIMFSLKYTKCILKWIPKRIFGALPSSVCQPLKVSTENTCRQEESLPLCFFVRKDGFLLR